MTSSAGTPSNCRGHRARSGRVADPHVAAGEHGRFRLRQRRRRSRGRRRWRRQARRATSPRRCVMFRVPARTRRDTNAAALPAASIVACDADIDDADVGAGLSRQHVDRRAAAQEVADHLRGHGGWIRTDALGSDAVIRGEDDDAARRGSRRQRLLDRAQPLRRSTRAGPDCPAASSARSSRASARSRHTGSTTLTRSTTARSRVMDASDIQDHAFDHRVPRRRDRRRDVNRRQRSRSIRRPSSHSRSARRLR